MTDHRPNPVTQSWQPRDELEAFALRFVEVFNDHDLEAGLAMCDPEVRARPSRATGAAGGYIGHEGVREWWRGVTAQTSWFEILVSSMQRVERRGTPRRAGAAGQSFLDIDDLDRRQADISTLAMFGDICLDGEPLSPWACVIVVRDGLIVRHRSYLSSRELLDEIGLIDAAVRVP